MLTLNGRHDWVETRTRNRLGGDRASQPDSAFSGRVGVNYLFDLGLSPYAAYSRSFQPLAGTTAEGEAFRPMKGEQYEVGVKYQPPGMTSFASLAAYHLMQENALTADPDNVNFSVQTGEVRVRGIELTAMASLTGGLDLTGSYSFTDSETTRSNGPDLGKRLAVTPRHQAALWAEQTIQSGPLASLGIGAGVRFLGEAYGDAANTLRSPPVTLFDASLRYDLGQLGEAARGVQLRLNASNLFDRTYVASCATTASCYYGNRRQVLATLNYRM